MWCFKIYPALVWNSNKYFLTPSKFLSCGMWRPTFEARGGNLGMGRELQLWHSSSLHMWTLWQLPERGWFPVWVSCFKMYLGQNLGSPRLRTLCCHILSAGSFPSQSHGSCTPSGCREPHHSWVWVHYLRRVSPSKDELSKRFLRCWGQDYVSGGKISLGK